MKDIFKAYDIRGVYPNQINSEVAFRIGRALANYLKVDTICVGRDMRLSSPEISKGLIDGIQTQGTNVIDLGLVSTDMVYFATGKYGYGGGVMITASHNPGEWNGMKMCKNNAIPLSSQNGLPEIMTMAIKNIFDMDIKQGQYKEKDIYDEWFDFALSFIDTEKIQPYKIAVDAGNGMAGKVISLFQKKLPKLKITPMYFELDGNFPNHLASPIEPENTEELRKKVKEDNLDMGWAFDGDADRVFLVDGEGNTVSGTVMTAMITDLMLSKNKEATILYNAICGKIVPEIIESYGAKGVRTRVGHSLIKEQMNKEKAIFAGEHSGHYYFKENYNADSALIAALVVVGLLSESGKSLSELNKKYSKYFASGEINSEVSNIQKKLEELKSLHEDAIKIDDLDGLTFYYNDYWFNVRPSNTEPLLRLNLEANTEELMKNKTSVILEEIRSQ